MANTGDIDWSTIDEMLFKEHWLPAIKAYREITGVGLNEAGERVSGRMALLRRERPECCKWDLDYRNDAYAEVPAAEARLATITDPVLVIEVFWDLDSFNLYTTIVAITDGPSRDHPRFREHYLLSIQDHDRVVETTKDIVAELAARAGVDCFLTSTDRTWGTEEPRWWDGDRR